MSFLRQFLSLRLVWLALLVSLGIGALFARAIWTIRQDEWSYAERTNANLAQMLEVQVSWSLEAMDKSLQAVVLELGRARVMALPPEMRQRMLFGNSLQTRGIGDVLVTDAQGNVVFDSSTVIARSINLADREYFQALQRGEHRGLYVGKPIVVRTTGLESLPLVRAYQHPDGRFAGVVVGVIPMNFFNELFATVDVGPNSGVSLLTDDGLFVARFPYDGTGVGKSVAGTESMRYVQFRRSGTWVGRTPLDGVHRMYSFHHVGPYPLIVGVAQSTDTILVQWRRSAWILGFFALLLMGACVGLTLLFTRQLAQRERVSAQLRKAEHNLRTILDNVPSLIGYWDVRLNNHFVNYVCKDWFGVAPEQLPGMGIHDLIGDVLYARSMPYMEQALQGHKQVFEFTFTDPQAVRHYCVASYVPDLDGSQVRGIFVQVSDITERKRIEDALFEEKERMRLTLKSIADAVVCTDAQGLVTYINPAAERLTGWQAFDAAHRPAEEVIGLPAADGISPRLSLLRQALEQNQAVETTRGVVLQRGTGKRLDVEESASPITGRQGQITGAVAVLRDVGAALAMAERMTHLAQYDTLTDLPNRLLLRDRARHALAQARRNGTCLAVLYIDLDGFKQVNDTLGHDVGDQLLIQLAQRLRAAVRESDTVCRQGGDEFVLLLPGLEAAEQARKVAAKIMTTCSTPIALAGQLLLVGLSGGISLFPAHGQTFEELSRHADAAMYAAKNAGRRQIRLYAGEGAEPVLLAQADV